MRIFDFPRLQIVGLLLLVLGLHLALLPHTPAAWALRALMLACLGLQVRRILPYTRLGRRQVLATTLAEPKEPLRLLFANVLQPQHHHQQLLQSIEAADPDVVLALETDDWWRQALSPLERSHPHTVLLPQDNTYGMLLYSRLPLHDVEVAYLVESDVPSIHATVRLAGGSPVRLHCLHPRPPAPAEHPDSVPRDAELLVVGRAIRQNPMATVVMGT